MVEVSAITTTHQALVPVNAIIPHTTEFRQCGQRYPHIWIQRP
jgi:hypothetical protein